MSQKSPPTAPAPETEPTAGKATGPIWLVVLLAGLFYWGTLYLDENAGEFHAAVYRPIHTTAELDAYQPKSQADALLAEGKRLYEPNCGTCHQSNGSGGRAQNCPPLARSDWVLAPGPNRLIRLVLHGGSGPITVLGETWQGGTMTPFGSVLSDAQIAAILTYIRGNTAWGNNASPVTPEQVRAVREQTADRDRYWSPDELLAIPASD